MSFAAIMTRRDYLRGHLVLDQRHEHPCFYRIESFSPRNHLHAFELRDLAQLSGEFSRFIGLGYRVGRQEHIEHRQSVRTRRRSG